MIRKRIVVRDERVELPFTGRSSGRTTLGRKLKTRQERQQEQYRRGCNRGRDRKRQR